MNKREAVVKSEEVWTIIAEKGLSKQDAFAEVGVGYSKTPKNACYLCQYTEDKCGFWNCSLCPMIGMWTEEEQGRCIDDGSPYLYIEDKLGKAANPGDPMYRVAAWDIVALHRQWLQENPEEVNHPASIGDTYSWCGTPYSIRRCGSDGLVFVALERENFYSGGGSPFGQAVLTEEQMQQEINALVNNYSLVYIGKLDDIIKIKGVK